ncbi:UNVERIFIED_CONTAM: hypothetical protein PYX00_010317 [Menopon gallinae]|uniref:Neurogenic protein big brain n=1 Tax=Menopon gallinae TaxID=328185 RepID=A0AAW2HFP9_9NEOP
MDGNNVAVSMEGDAIEDHIATLMEKLEAMRQSKESAGSASKRYRQPFQTEIRTLEFWRSIISECLATFFFVFIVSGSGLAYSSKVPGGYGGDVILATALASGLSMAILSQCFGNISGGHVNPAVSLAMAAAKKISPMRAVMFVIAQCGGGIAGAALIYGVNASGQYPVVPTATLGSWERFGVELVLTFIVVFTHCTVSEKKLFGNGATMIGFAYAACSIVGLPMLNPARALGPAFVMNKLWENHWVFWFGPVVGGVLAAFIYEFIFNAKRHGKRAKDSINGDSSSIQSEDEPYEDNKYHPAAYRPVGSGNPTSPGGAYCPSVASASVYSSPPPKLERMDSKYGKPAEGIYSGSRSLYNAKITDGIYGGTKSMYTKSPSLTRASLNRSQSVYAKTQNPRDILPKPGPLIPAQSLYPIKLGNGGHLTANMRDFGTPNGNFIAGVKTNDGSFVKVPQMAAGFNQNTLNFLAGRTGGSKSYHDITDTCDKSGMLQNFGAGNHVTNQNVQNQHLQNAKPEKGMVENIYGIRNSPTGGIYPGNDVPRQENAQDKREGFDLVLRGTGNQASSNFSRTAAYVKSVQNNPGCKPRESNYDIVPSGIREVPNFSQKPHNRSETSDYGSNRSDTSIYGMNRQQETANRQDENQNGEPSGFKRPEKPDSDAKKCRPEMPLPEEAKNDGRGGQKMQFPMNGNYAPPPMQGQQWNQMQMRPLHQGGKAVMPQPSPNAVPMPGPLAMNYANQRNENRQSPLSSVSSTSFSRNSPNPPY